MKATLRYFSASFLFWVVFFAGFKCLFLVYHWQRFDAFSFPVLLQVVWHGLYMDASMAGYFCLFPGLVWILRPWLSASVFKKILAFYTVPILAFAGLVLTADLEIFNIWGHRIDAAVVPYLQYPKEAFASAYSSPLRVLVVCYLLTLISFLILGKRILGYISESAHSPWIHGVSGLLLTAGFIIPIRGGFQLAPMNQSSVYFSSERILNQAAENGVWVLMQSLVEGGSNKLNKEYETSSEAEVQSFFTDLYSEKELPTPDTILRHPSPNVVLIVWESLSSKVVGSFGGKFPSTPSLDHMASQGISFKRLFASGDRSDKGLGAILASVPAVGKISIMSQPNLSSRLIFLNQKFKKRGYQTMYLYGGELEFANMKSFMLNAGFDKLIGKGDFPPESYNSKWGAHDEVLFNRQLQEAAGAKEPFFHTLFTLSSHEPFEVPGVVHSGKEPLDSLFCRAHRYTDRCLGEWLKKASEETWWKNTLVVVIADHGHALPGLSSESDTMKYKIPMVWYGPVLAKRGMKVNTLGSQTDLFRTLMTRMGESAGFPVCSRDLFAGLPNSFAFFSFRNGSAFLQNNQNVICYDPCDAQNKAGWYRQWVYSTYYKNTQLKPSH